MNDKEFRQTFRQFIWFHVQCSIRVCLFNKRAHMKKDKNSSPDGTAHHGAQQGKAVAGSGHSQSQYLPCMLARAYKLKATSGYVYHP
ncbi:hypothetical protein AVEN_12640-1 [Araneus ventricosus]|uniref:Uncharacterized protein n=1 Tax=Araneus ventricosus TaxID=182803 RepID=A0A4Y2ACH4_ARAVE|nr:hypothetical protein AVEN_12640-1 [Araneus ventricosus]